MRHKRLSAWTAVMALVLAMAGGARGDDDPARARGFQAGSMYQFNDIDSINTFNGNLMLNVPVGPEYKTNGSLRYQFHLFYNSNLWDYQAIEGVITSDVLIGPQYGQQRYYAWFDDNFNPRGGGSNNQGGEAFPAQFNAGLGWQFSLTGSIAVGHNNNASYPYHYVSYKTGDGVWHTFTPRLHGDITTLPASEFLNDVYYTRDGSYMRSTRLPDRSYIIDKPDGTRERFICLSDCGPVDPYPQYVLDQISDPFGNVLWLQRSADGFTETYIESVGTGAYLDHNTAPLTEVRRHVVVFEAGGDCVNHRRVKSLTLPAPPSVAAPVYRFLYDEPRLLRSRETFWGENSYLVCPFEATSGEGTKLQVSLLKKIDVPEGRTAGSSGDWSFGYIVDPRNPEHAGDYPDDVVTKTWGPVTWEASYVAGRVYKVTLPTGGSVRYKYERRPFRKVVCNTVARLGITAIGVRERQVLNTDGTEDGSPWRYYRGNVTPGGTFNWCGANEILSLTVDPLGNTTAAFFMASANFDWGQPFLRSVPDSDGTRFLSSQTYKCNVLSFLDSKELRVDETLTREPWGDAAIRRVVQRYTEPGVPTTCGPPVRSTYVRYEDSGRDCNGDVPGDCVQANKRVVSERTVYHDDKSGTIEATSTIDRSDFDGFGHYRVEKTGGNFYALSFPSRAGGDERITLTNYNPGVFFNSVDGTFTFPSGYNLASYPWPRMNTYDLSVVREALNGTVNPPAPVASSTLFRFDPLTGYLLRKRQLGTSTPCDRDAANFARCTSLLRANDVLMDYERTQSADGETTIIESAYGGDRGTLSTSSVDLSVIGGNPEYLQKTVLQYGEPKRRTHLTCGRGDYLTVEENVVHAPSGLVTQSADSSGAKTSYEYDALYRYYRIDPPGNDPAAVYTYSAPTATARAGADIVSGSLKTSRIEWDHLGRVAFERNHVPNGTSTLTHASARSTWYHPNGWKQYESTVGPPADTPGHAAGVSFFKYDAFGRVAEVQHPDHVAGPGSTNRRRTLYDYRGIREIDEIVEGVYPGNNNQTKTTRTYDRFGRLARVNEPAGAGGAAAVTVYEYDPQGHLLHVESPNGQHRRFTYDMRGFLTSETHPELAGNWIYHAALDPRGNAGQLLYSPPNGAQRTSFDLKMLYDPAGRLVEVLPFVPRTSESGERSVQTFTFHPQLNGAVPVSGTGFLTAGKLKSATRRNWVHDPARTGDPLTVTVTESLSYDVAGGTGRTNGRTTTANGMTFGTTYSYNGLGNVTGITYSPLTRSCPGCAAVASPRTVAFQYLEGTLSGIPGFAPTIAYHRNGSVASVVHANGTTDTIGADPNLLPRPKRITTTFVGSASFTTGDYVYDARSNIMAIGPNSYTYDPMGRLTAATLPGASQSYAYDANGNMTSFAGQSLPLDGSTNRLTSISGALAQYDVAGNLEKWRDPRAADVLTTFEWDPLRMMTHVSDVNQGKIHAYNASNERIVTFDYKASPGNIVETWSLRGLDNQVLRDFVRTRSASTAAESWSWRDYIRRNRVPVALIRSTASSSETLHYHVDHLGSIRRMSNAAGSVVDQQDYLPFGQELQERPDDNRMKFTGHERDDNGTAHAFGDLDYMHARYYAPMLGRFLSMDRALGSSTAPQSWNRYSYARNNPLALSDPDGNRMARLYDRDAEHEIDVEIGDVVILYHKNDQAKLARHMVMVAGFSGRNALIVENAPKRAKVDKAGQVAAEPKGKPHSVRIIDATTVEAGGFEWNAAKMAVLGVLHNSRTDGDKAWTTADVRAAVSSATNSTNKLEYDPTVHGATEARTDCAGGVNSFLKHLPGSKLTWRDESEREKTLEVWVKELMSSMPGSPR